MGEKPKYPTILVVVAIFLLVGACASGFIAGTVTARATSDSGSTTGAEGTEALFTPLWETWQIVHQHYLEQPVDDVAMMQGAIRGMLEALGDPACYDHPVDQVRRVETHISHVLLTGDFAYKIKKPLNLGFLDFSSLDKRLHACREEIRLNRRLAPGIYLDVVPITGSPAAPRINGSSEAFEYAVKMRQFPPDATLDRLDIAAFRAVYRGESLHLGVSLVQTPPPDASPEEGGISWKWLSGPRLAGFDFMLQQGPLTAAWELSGDRRRPPLRRRRRGRR